MNSNRSPLKTIPAFNMRSIVLGSLIIGLVLSSCLTNSKLDVKSFRTGSYKTVLEDENIVSTAYRNDSLQIEEYQGKKDTFYIKWLDSFEYVLRKKHPKNKLDSTDFHVKITAVKENSYEFKAYYRGSNFKQKGEAFKLD